MRIRIICYNYEYLKLYIILCRCLVLINIYKVKQLFVDYYNFVYFKNKLDRLRVEIMELGDGFVDKVFVK